MRLGSTVFVALGTVLWAGCASDDGRRAPEWLQRMQSVWTDVRPDAMQMEFAYVRRPLGDAYLCEGLWHEVDENCVPLEKRPLLAANGLRVGIVSGAVPAKLQNWLCSDGQSDGHRLVQRTGHVSFVPIGPSGSDRTIAVSEERGSRTLRLESVQCGLAVRLSIADSGDTQLQLEPRVRYGSLGRLPHLAKDGQNLEVTAERPEERFPELTCELSLTPSDYLIVGGLPDRPFTLGYTAFVEPETNQQLILVIRTPRAKPVGQPFDSPKTAGGLPLAVQSANSSPAPAKSKRG
jgi:hypothetical protein